MHPSLHNGLGDSKCQCPLDACLCVPLTPAGPCRACCKNEDDECIRWRREHGTWHGMGAILRPWLTGLAGVVLFSAKTMLFSHPRQKQSRNPCFEIGCLRKRQGGASRRRLGAMKQPSRWGVLNFFCCSESSTDAVPGPRQPRHSMVGIVGGRPPRCGRRYHSQERQLNREPSSGIQAPSRHRASSVGRKSGQFLCLANQKLHGDDVDLWLWFFGTWGGSCRYRARVGVRV